MVKIDKMAKPMEHTAAWLYRVAHDKIINFINKKRELQFPNYYDNENDSNIQEMLEVFCEKKYDPETEYLRPTVMDGIKIALAELPKEQREVFEQTEFLGIPVKEIAKKTKVPINTVLSRKYYAVKHLCKYLKELYDDVVKKRTD
jgi:RNA polymerase sigma factor (sigma-70 family)